MGRLRKAFGLPLAEWLLVLRATFWLAIIEAGLRLFRFRTLLRILDGKTPRSRVLGAQSWRAERVAYCVELASRFDPLPATCLKKALVLYALLSRQGSKVRLLIGAAKTICEPGSGIDYHAWLEYQGRVIMGGGGGQHYMPLYRLDGPPPASRQGQPVA